MYHILPHLVQEYQLVSLPSGQTGTRTLDIHLLKHIIYIRFASKCC